MGLGDLSMKRVITTEFIIIIILDYLLDRKFICLQIGYRENLNSILFSLHYEIISVTDSTDGVNIVSIDIKQLFICLLVPHD